MAVDSIIFTQISKNETKWWLGEKAEAARTNRGGGSLLQQRYHLPASYNKPHYHYYYYYYQYHYCAHYQHYYYDPKYYYDYSFYV